MENRIYVMGEFHKAEEKSRRAYLPYLINAEIEGMKKNNERLRNITKITNHIH